MNVRATFNDRAPGRRDAEMSVVRTAIANVAVAGAIALSACTPSHSPAQPAVPARSDSAARATDVPVAPVVARDEAAPRPASVPAEARAVVGALTTGDATPDDRPFDQQDVLYAIQCADDVIVVSTTRETVYAAAPCAQALPDEVFRPYLAHPIVVRVLDTRPRQLHLSSSSVGSVAFQIGDAWLLAR